MVVKAGARRDDVTHDHVFLEAAQVINLGTGRGLGQHAGRVLKGRGAQEAVGFERRLGDAEQHGGRFRRLAAHLVHAFVFGLELELVHLFAPEELGVARLGDANLAEHLAHDDLDVLVVDRHALQTINFLHFADQMFLQFLRPADLQDLMRVNGALGELLAFLDHVALEDDDVAADRDEMLLFRVGRRILDEDAALAAHARAEVHEAVNLGDLGRVFRTAGFKQLGHARQTAGDVLGIGSLAGRFRHQRSGHDLVAFVEHDVPAGGDRIVGHDFALVIADDDLRVQIFLVVNDDHGLLAGRLVHLLLHGDTLDDVMEPDLAGLLGKDRHIVRIPLDERVALLDVRAVLEGDDRADDDGVILQLATVVAQDGDRAVLVQNDVVAVFHLNEAQFVIEVLAVVLGLDLRHLEPLRRRAADMERAHGQLGAGFADGLRGDDAGGFAEFHERTGRHAASVAMDADAVLALASEHGADAHPVNGRGFEALGLLFVNLFVRTDEEFLRVRRVDDVVARKTAHDPVGQLDHFVFAFIHGGDPDAVGGAAILLLDDDVLRHVHELAGHVAGIGGLERGVGQTLSGAVGGDEEFQQGQAVAESRENRVLDDVAAGLGHEAAQTGELTHLLFVTTRAGIHHQIDGVVFLLALVLFERAEHDAGDLVGAVRPDVHDLVIAFARRDDTLAILLLDFADLLVRAFDLLVAFLRDDHVINADGNAGLGRFAET